LQYSNTDHLVSNKTWDILLQKTGFINEAGHCLVMRAIIEGRAIIMVFLDSKGKYSHIADAGRIRKWLEEYKPTAVVHSGLATQG
jgi:D-alanyl-D-alanine endopeptidase (penicillin-binding protein 7)